MILFFCLNEGKGKCQKVHSSLEASEEKQVMTFSENCFYKDIGKTWNLGVEDGTETKVGHSDDVRLS